MRLAFSSIATRAALVAFVAGSFAIAPMASGNASARPTTAAAKYLTAFASEPTSGWTSENFNPFSATANDFTNGGIYEPLMVITQAGGGKTYPWLATSVKWTNHNKTLLVNLRHNVKWSDGKPFTAADVVFTFNYGKKYKIDPTGLMSSGQITRVSAKGKYQVVFNFKTVDTTILQSLLANVRIIPEHAWKNVHNPTTYLNSHPVGTGPFTRILSFSNQEYVLGRNPHYWKHLAYAGIKVPAFSSNTSALASMVAGQVDWAPVYVQDAQKAYVDKDKKHYHYFYSPAPLALFFNDQQYPYNIVALRKAISMSIDRHALSVKGGERLREAGRRRRNQVRVSRAGSTRA